MEKINIENYITNKKGIGWIVLLGWIPFLNVFLAIFLVAAYPSFSVGIRRTPFFRISKNKTLGDASFWGIFYMGITLIYIILTVLFIDYLKTLHFWTYLSVPLATFIIVIYLITYNMLYKNYIIYVNDFLNEIMLRGKPDESNNQPVTFKGGFRKDTKIYSMLEDLKRNNIIKTEKSNNRNEKIISFTPEFQQQMSTNITYQL